MCELSVDHDVSIGRPLPNVQTYILDTRLQPVPIGVAGELHIGGAGLALGYLNRPDLTAASFIVNPFGGGRLFRTGDRVRWRADGQIEFLGRMDNQVKVRGYRVELEEVEAVVREFAGVRQVAVIAGEKGLVAYVVGTNSVDELRQFLQRKLPEFMVPAAFVVLDALPMTPAGKVDRLALPKAGEVPQTVSGEFVAPRTATEKQVAQIWCDVLGIAKVGVHDNFLYLGGHSLLALQVVSRLRSAVTIRDVFEFPTVASLSIRVERSQQRAVESTIVRVPRNGDGT
jgi:hypothetical protein